MNFQAHTGAERYQKRSFKITTDIIKKLGTMGLECRGCGGISKYMAIILSLRKWFSYRQ